jgi:hypothetical protein
MLQSVKFKEEMILEINGTLGTLMIDLLRRELLECLNYVEEVIDFEQG